MKLCDAKGTVTKFLGKPINLNKKDYTKKVQVGRVVTDTIEEIKKEIKSKRKNLKEKKKMITYTVLSIKFVVLNIFFVWYFRQFIIRFNFFSKNLGNLMAVIVQGYQAHLESVYGLETFYGDSTLRGLLEHTKDLSEFR